MTMTDQQEQLGQAIDRVENIAYALKIPLPDKIHVEQIRALLPEIVDELKSAFVAVTSENPWGEFNDDDDE